MSCHIPSHSFRDFYQIARGFPHDNCFRTGIVQDRKCSRDDSGVLSLLFQESIGLAGLVDWLCVLVSCALHLAILFFYLPCALRRHVFCFL